MEVEATHVQGLQSGPKLKCNVCKGKDFDLREGFYFCQECGTKQEHAREFAVENEYQYSQTITKKEKLEKEEKDRPNLTSWECYNYILLGLVHELMQLGAKAEIKTITLQLWTAYLRRKEIAFFSKKGAELPRLSARFFKRDANILYNHKAKELKKRKRKASDKQSSTAGDSSIREWRKSKRQLDESLYSDSRTSLQSSSTGVTSRAIRLRFSSHARKILKKHVPVKHLKKHEEDAEGLLKCHEFPLKKRKLTDKETAMSRTTIRDLYTILAIALNLVEDDIQLTDLVRFNAEGHIGSKNVLHYIPENIIMYGKEMLKDISFNRYHNKVLYRSLRDNVAFIGKLIGLQEYQTPNFIALARRYINELNLPKEMISYVERLINLFPPQMKTRSNMIYPAYEARSMAYIVFVLKLLFGLDGHTEHKISEAAKNINLEIHNASERIQSRHEKLFVWSEWVEYIEMRKVIISQYNATYSQLYKIEQNISQQLEELKQVVNMKTQEDVIVSDVERDISVATEEQVSNLHCIMEQYKNINYGHVKNENPDSITFPPSCMPSDSYFKRIRLHAAINNNPSKKNIKIPEFMHVDHTQRTIEPYLKAKPLREFLQELDIKLNVKRMPCTDKRCFVGMFVNAQCEKVKAYQADFDISEKEWLENIVEEPFPEEIVFRKKLDCYKCPPVQKNESPIFQRQLRKIDRAIMTHVLNGTVDNDTEDQFVPFDALSMASIEVFSENNMEPIKNITLKGPRRNLDNVNILEDNENDELTDQEDEDENSSFDGNSKSVDLITSEMDYWVLLGHISEMTDLKKKNLESKFPRSFFWLLETCAQVIHVDWGVLYDQLLALEITFGYGIESLHDLKDCIRLIPHHKIKDLNTSIRWYREIW